ncbi:protein FAM169B isoform X4 [Bubalus bubalis]|uniref:protein FAM169B isoform X4 n=1 Tax=Bubalus bubalis TaxID=89462 RepID=UPI001E1B81AB|nr:protein FAM169B isoform X4 [Bubalus bubalis]
MGTRAIQGAGGAAAGPGAGHPRGPGRGGAQGARGSMDAEAARGAAAGIYPVDILEDDPAGHQEATLAYYAMLGEGAGPSPEVFSLPTGEQVELEASSVCFCTMHRDEPQHKILVLVNPQDTKTVVAVYVKQSWWTTEDVLRTSDPSREGLMKVQSFGERIVLFILNVVIFGRLERNLDDDDMFFLPHSVKEEAKILWRDGAAVGFYTTKSKGSLCGDGTGTCYLLPVFDTVFVRRRHRRRGLGLAMLRDFCQTFREDEALGVSWPISPAMYQDQSYEKTTVGGLRPPLHPPRVVFHCGPEQAGRVCRKFLTAHPAERGRLWEVEPPGAWGQRDNIWLKVQLQQSRLHLDSHPGHSKEAMATRGQTSQDDGPRLSHNGEDHKERISGDREQTGGDHALKAAEGWLARACPAGQEGRTPAGAGLPGGPACGPAPDPRRLS